MIERALTPNHLLIHIGSRARRERAGRRERGRLGGSSKAPSLSSPFGHNMVNAAIKETQVQERERERGGLDVFKAEDFEFLLLLVISGVFLKSLPPISRHGGRKMRREREGHSRLDSWRTGRHFFFLSLNRKPKHRDFRA